MTNEARIPEARIVADLAFGFRHSFGIRHSGFVIYLPPLWDSIADCFFRATGYAMRHRQCKCRLHADRT